MEMKIRSAELETVCGYTSTLPETALPEIGFAGKSNVGKSSLINVLMNRRHLARVGQTPGKTRTINFYRVDAIFGEEDRDYYLVDLPGYGYANVPESEKARWGKMIERYLHTSRSLRAIVLLVDIRHAPGANDRQMAEWIRRSGCEMIIAATKADKIRRSQLLRQLKLVREGLGVPKETPVIPFSAQTRQGLEELSRCLGRVLGVAEAETAPAAAEDGKADPAETKAGAADGKTAGTQTAETETAGDGSSMEA